jgi:hypothetical protein
LQTQLFDNARGGNRLRRLEERFDFVQRCDGRVLGFKSDALRLSFF